MLCPRELPLLLDVPCPTTTPRGSSGSARKDGRNGEGLLFAAPDRARDFPVGGFPVGGCEGPAECGAAPGSSAPRPMGWREPRRLPAPIKGSGWRRRVEAASMEGRRWSAGLSAAVLLMLQGLAFTQGPSCNRTQYQSNGRCCSRCPPGHKVAAACSGESSTICSPCEEHHFQASWTKEPHCTPHHICNLKAGLIVYRNGSKERDIVCRCREGTHCSSNECETCRPHTSCGKGEGVQQDGNHVNDTLCAPCSLGHFSNVSSSTAWCQPWSRCQEGQVQKTNGTQATDVVCEPAPVTREARKSHLLVLLPIAAFLLGALLFLWHRRGKCPRKRHHDLPPEPTENEEDCPAFPTQETLLGEQAGMQEKDCHLAQQEQV
ncbi:tumor necrosis factor receptor superfamily member 5 isoform X2 [Ahaetulla prasina]|uniref:tumor necrosis factor receptor superfamily member 5 isoform X2 n=1 Tax=Ahaetulla prasina TaxID=499056 RepID=UPI00264A0F06|nr:tumor necrosis factor receptor superfamily member 5 isoform X2 [Ahaetulla prasina]